MTIPEVKIELDKWIKRKALLPEWTKSNSFEHTQVNGNISMYSRLLREKALEEIAKDYLKTKYEII